MYLRNIETPQTMNISLVDLTEIEKLLLLKFRYCEKTTKSEKKFHFFRNNVGDIFKIL